MAKFTNPTKVVTGKNTRFSYLIVNEPKAINGGTPKYSVSLIIPKSDTMTVEKIQSAIKAAYDEGQSKLKGNGKFVPALDTIKTPLRDGDKERYVGKGVSKMVMKNVLMTQLTRAAISSMRTVHQSLA